MAFSGESVGAIHGTLDLDRDPFTRGLEEARAQVKAFESERHQVTIDAILSGWERAKAELDAFHDKTVKVKVQVDRSQAAGLLGPGVGVSDATALAKLDELQRKVDALHGKTIEVKAKTDSAGFDLARNKMASIAVAAAALGPQVLGALGQAALGAGALSVATGGAALSFGILGKAVQDTLSGQATQSTQLRAIATAQKQLTAQQNLGATSTAAQQTAYNALVAAEKSGNAQRIQLAKTHLAVVQSSTRSQLQGNQALIQAERQHLAALKADYHGQNQLAQQVNTSIANVKNQVENALAPAVQQVLHGLLPLLTTLGTAIGGLAGPFGVLGAAVRAALSSPQTQAGIRSLVTGFGEVVKASAPLAGPIVQGLVSLGKVLVNIAKAAMPVLVQLTKEFVGWLGKLATTSGTPRFAAMLRQWSGQFGTLVKDIIDVGKALAPLFASAAGFQPLIGAVIAVVSGFTHLLASLGPVGRLLAGGLGIYLIASRFAMLKSVLGLLSGAFVKLGGVAIAGLLTAFPGLVGGILGATTSMSAFAAATWAAIGPILAIAAPILAFVAVVVLVIKFHKQLGEAVVAVWHAIEAVVKAVVGVLVSVVTAGWNFIKSHIKLVMEALVVIVTGGLGLIVILFVKFHKQIEAAVKAAWDWVLNAIKNAWKWIETAVGDGMKLVVKLVKKLPGMLLSALGSLVSDFFHLGVNIIEGLISGIGSLAGELAKAMYNLAKSAVEAPFKAVLGIFSPSTVFAQHGRNIGQGLINGMLSQHAAVTAAAKQLAGAGMMGLGPVIGAVNASGQSAASAPVVALKLALTNLTKAIINLTGAVSRATGSTLSAASSAGSFAASSPGLAKPIFLGPATPQPSGGLHGAPAGPAIVVNQHFASLVPGTPAQLRQISTAVSEAHRRTESPGGPPRRSWGR